MRCLVEVDYGVSSMLPPRRRVLSVSPDLNQFEDH